MIMPVKQKCPMCHTNFMGSDCIGKPCSSCCKKSMPEFETCDKFTLHKESKLKENCTHLSVFISEHSNLNKNMGKVIPFINDSNHSYEVEFDNYMNIEHPFVEIYNTFNSSEILMPSFLDFKEVNNKLTIMFDFK